MDLLLVEVVGALFVLALINLIVAGYQIDATGRRERSSATGYPRTRSRPSRYR